MKLARSPIGYVFCIGMPYFLGKPIGIFGAKTDANCVDLAQLVKFTSAKQNTENLP